MKPLPVRALMSSPVLTIAPHTRLPTITSLLRENNIRRLPVLDHGRLVGIVTLSDVRSALPSEASTLSIYEMSYLFDQVTARDIMGTKVITVAAKAPVIEATKQMLTHKVSGLPVMYHGRVAGIITESDIFRAVVAGALALAAPPVVTQAQSPPPAVPMAGG